MENDTTKKLYEVGYLLIPLIPEDKVADEVNTVRSYIENTGGFIVSEEQPKMRKLSYEIKQRGMASKKARFEDAYFGSMRFQATAEAVLAVNESLDKNDKILRFLMIKTVKEVPRVPRTGVPAKSKSEVVDLDKKVIMSDVELDKEIDQLLDVSKVVA
ncbi:MAG: 30S ribosomal protein S6 [bacterium]|nr:30S ribosomal protein S6 [bacterium]